MIINKITPSLDYNYWLNRLETYLNESTNQNSIKVPKVVKPTNKNKSHKTLGTSILTAQSSLPP